jgi:hypothetical protein
MLLRPFDSDGTRLLITERIETLRGGRPLERPRRGLRHN